MLNLKNNISTIQDVYERVGITVVNQYGQTSKNSQKVFNMIDNYIYLYHTDTLIALPTYPETISESTSVNYQSTNILARSAPIYTYSNSGPRSLQINLQFHRDMMNEINVANSNLNLSDLSKTDYVDTLINQMESMALPKYAAAEKMVDPPIVALRIGNDIFCKGIISGSVSKEYSGPILRTNKYAMVAISFTMFEIDPYDAETVAKTGSFRGLNTTLERRVWKRRT